MAICPNCGAEAGVGVKFCRKCGTRVVPEIEDSATWKLAPQTGLNGQVSSTTRINPAATEGQAHATEPVYVPPAPSQLTSTQMGAKTVAPSSSTHIALGDWLSEGWRIYRENGVLMSVASLLGVVFTVCTASILGGPILMGLYRMAFKAIRGERPQIEDLFKWEGRFLQAFLAFLIYIAAYAALDSGSRSTEVLSAFGIIIKFAIMPFLTVILSFVIPLILERKMDVAAAIQRVGRMVFSRDALMWWAVGIVFSTLSLGGIFGICIGLFVTFPWIVCSSAVAFRDIFGLHDPNKTLH